MTKHKPLPDEIPSDEPAEAPPEAPPPPAPEPEPVSKFKRSPMEDPNHPLHHLRDA